MKNCSMRQKSTSFRRKRGPTFKRIEEKKFSVFERFRRSIFSFSTAKSDAETSRTVENEPFWSDLLREDKKTIEAWAKIRRRFNSTQQKDIFR